MSIEWTHHVWILIAGATFLLTMIVAHFVEERKRNLSRRFSTITSLHYSEPRRIRRFFKWLFMALGLALVGLSLADPRFGVEIREIAHKGRDIVFILDVSKSMLASDVTPTRLKRAKLDISDSLSGIRGHRLGLIVFAGRPKELCPLTYDYHHFMDRLKKADPSSVPLGGTNIGDALRKAMDLIQSGAELGNDKDVVLITDGQDLEGFYEEAAKQAGELGISIYTVGIGQASGTSIRLADGTYLKHEGKRVETALNPEPLQLISEYSAGGFYQNLSASHQWLGNILKHIETKKQTEKEVDRRERKIPRYQITLGLAMLLWMLSLLVQDRPGGLKTA